MTQDAFQVGRLARHEAGHAVTAVRLGLRCRKVSIIDGHGWCGVGTASPCAEQHPRWQARRVIVKLGGYAASILAFGDDERARAEAGRDLEQAGEIVQAMRPNQAPDLEPWITRALLLVAAEPNRTMIVRVADALAERGRLDGPDLVELLHR